MRRLFVFFLAFISCFAQAQRLPKDVVPAHYKIDFHVDLASGTLSGDESIEVVVKSATNTITLNDVGHAIEGASLSVDGAAIPATVTTDEANEMVTFHLAKPAPAGAAILRFKFSGKLRTDLRGLYVAKAKDRNYAVTQFEGTYARMAFPSFDEPEFKATFDVSVEADESETAISNAPIARVTPGPGAHRHTIQFARSPKISTYLVALAVGDFGCVEGAADGIPIRICALREKKEMGTYALHAAEKFLTFYNRYYGIKYPFGKLDMLAIPDYEWGGMENTASIFYKERALLIDEKTASVNAKRGVASVVAHEMAHQWFGDLVTMQWWDNVWLNEGFATWMTFKALQDFDPTLDQSLERVQSAGFVMGADSLASTRPIRANGNTPAEIKELFDGIAYQKGAAVLDMLESFVGVEVFRKGVNNYLAKHANGNATAEDFWSELAAASGKPVDRVMATFIDQPGFPLIKVEESCSSGRSPKTNVELSQLRFSNVKNPPEVWNVPLCTRALDAKTSPSCQLFTQRKQTFTFDGCHTVLINAGGNGYYRTAYSADAFAKVAKAASSQSLTAAESMVLLSDQWALTRAGIANIGDYLTLTDSLRHAKERALVESVLGRLEFIGGTFASASTRPKYNAWMMQVMQPTRQNVGSEPTPKDTDDRRSLRAMLFAMSGDLGDKSVVERSRAMVEQHLKDPATVVPSLAGVAIDIAASNGDVALYDRFVAELDRNNPPEVYGRYLFAMTLFRQPELTKRSLEFVLSPKMRSQDVVGFMSSLIANDASRDASWTFLKAHWPELHDKVVSFGGGGAVRALGSYCDAGHRQDIEEFFKANRAPGAERAVKQTLERISDCIAFKSGQQANFDAWAAKLPN